MVSVRREARAVGLAALALRRERVVLHAVRAVLDKYSWEAHPSKHLKYLEIDAFDLELSTTVRRHRTRAADRTPRAALAARPSSSQRAALEQDGPWAARGAHLPGGGGVGIVATSVPAGEWEWQFERGRGGARGAYDDVESDD